jgi:hypothetical protein
MARVGFECTKPLSKGSKAVRSLRLVASDIQLPYNTVTASVVYLMTLSASGRAVKGMKFLRLLQHWNRGSECLSVYVC